MAIPILTTKEVIHNTLVNAVLAGEFPVTIYDKETRLMSHGTGASIGGIEVNDLSSRFRSEARHGRELVHDRHAWIWVMRVRFNQEVMPEVFERSLTLTPIVIPQDPDNGVDRGVILHLQSATYEHPPRGGSSNGTKIVMRFNANLLPI